MRRREQTIPTTLAALQQQQRTPPTTSGTRFVITGPPAAGKTTWVAEHAQPGDVRWDFDAIAVAISGMAAHNRPEELVKPIEAMRVTLIDWLANNPTAGRVFVITSRLARAEEIAARLNAQLIVIDTPEAECLRRLAADPHRAQRREQQSAAVAAWHQAWSSRPRIAAGKQTFVS